MSNTAAASLDLSNITISTTVGSTLDGIDVTGSAVADTITGTAGDDAITGNGGNDVITGGAGDDTMIGSAGDDTYSIAFGGEGTDTITFVIADDVIDFTGTSDVNDAAGSDIDVDAMTLLAGDAAAVITHGLTIINGANATGIDAGNELTAAEIATFLGDMDGNGAGVALTVGTAADVAYVLVEGQNGVSTLAQVTGGSDTTIDTADVTIIAHLGTLESEDFTAANFSDFG